MTALDFGAVAPHAVAPATGSHPAATAAAGTSAIAQLPLRWILPVDAMALTVSVLLCVAVLNEPMALTMFVAAALIAAMAWSGYLAHDLSSGGLRPSRCLTATARVIVAVAVVGVILPGVATSQAVIAALMSGGFVWAGRVAIDRWIVRQRTAGRLRIPVIVRGTAEEIVQFATWLERDPGQPLAIVAVQAVDGRAVRGHSEHAVPADWDVSDAAQEMSAAGVIALASTMSDPDDFRQFVWDVKNRGLRVFSVPATTAVTPPKVHRIGATGISALSFESDVDNGFKAVLRSAFDMVGAALLVVVFSPMLLMAGALVRLSSPGPMFFLQERVGQNGRTFKMIKFRSMYQDAEQRKAELADQNIHDAGTLFKIPDDPRVTPVGRVLRRYSVDELPQLFNVLRGEMSLVGPRPPLPDEVAEYCREAHRRFRVKPGLTGLWQVSGRSDLDPQESRRLDTHYVEHTSLTLDLQILAKTVKAVLSGSGAY